jgi:dGTPase
METLGSPRSALAANPDASRGREFALEGSIARGPRTAYQRDRDRVIHSVAFRRLRHKTQVFVAPDGDHYRVRMTHSLEVAQIGRVIARQLGLDEDLTEAICLAHDIGHPPFGHAGEDALDAALSGKDGVGHGGWCHNAQALRTLMRLDSPYCEHDGLNLSWELLEGLAKHNGPVTAPNWALAELDAAFRLDLAEWAGLEAQVAAIADDIAYDNHDIDDGLRAGFLTLDDLMEQPFVADQWRAVEHKHPNAPRERQLRELVRSQIGIMVNDVIGETCKRSAGLASPADVRAAGQATCAFSPELAEEERKLKRFMYDRLYYHPDQLATAHNARAVTAALFAAYVEQPVLMGASWAARCPDAPTPRARHIADYIAGMTDRFAIAQYGALFGAVPAGLSNV